MPSTNPFTQHLQVVRTLTSCVILLCALLCLPNTTMAADESVTRFEQFVRAGQLKEATNLGRRLSESPDLQADMTLSFARLARELQKANQLADASEFYHLAVVASTRPEAKALSPQKAVLVRLAAGTVLHQTSQLDKAIAAIAPTLEETSGASDSQRATAISVLLRIGATAFANGSAPTASRAYSVAAKHARGPQKPTAILGDAWAMAIRGEQPLDAAKKLASFVDQFPNHADAARAARASAECLKQAERPDDAQAMLADLLQRWPNSEAALEVIRSHSDLAVDLVPESVGDWFMKRAKADGLSALDPKTTKLGLLVAARRNDPAAWSNLVKHLAASDKSGQSTSDVLSQLTEHGQQSDAEQLAAMFIAPKKDTNVAPTAREAACRWAGRTQRWSMLALASESESLEESGDQRTTAVERLFAEALTQTGQLKEASAWWNHLVDTRRVDDFGTLLRCAEAETSVGGDATMAEKRIATAREAAGGEAFHMGLVDLLDAELSIRRTEFDQARSLLERVVRSNETDVSLRGRAQWLIGETHYLQRSFTEAIEAYRQVEGIDSSGTWTAAALVQAGKSFEQLGRTREAAVCYGHLLSRFAESSHAKIAGQRLAAIQPDAPQSLPNKTSPEDRSSQPTIRR